MYLMSRALLTVNGLVSNDDQKCCNTAETEHHHTELSQDLHERPAHEFNNVFICGSLLLLSSIGQNEKTGNDETDHELYEEWKAGIYTLHSKLYIHYYNV